MHLLYNFKWKVSKRYISVLYSTKPPVKIPEHWNSRAVWLVLRRHCLNCRRLESDLDTQTLPHLPRCHWKRQLCTQVCFGDGKRRNVSIIPVGETSRSRVRQCRVGQHDLLPRFEGRHPYVRAAGAAESIAQVTLPHGTVKLVSVPRLVEGKTEKEESTHASTGRLRHVSLLLLPFAILLQLLSKTAGATRNTPQVTI